MEEEDEGFLNRTTPEAVLELLKLDGTFDKLRAKIGVDLVESGVAEKLRAKTKEFLEESGVLASTAARVGWSNNNKAASRALFAELLKEVDRERIPGKISPEVERVLGQLQDPLNEKVGKALADLKEVGLKRASTALPPLTAPPPTEAPSAIPTVSTTCIPEKPTNLKVPTPVKKGVTTTHRVVPPKLVERKAQGVATQVKKEASLAVGSPTLPATSTSTSVPALQEQHQNDTTKKLATPSVQGNVGASAAPAAEAGTGQETEKVKLTQEKGEEKETTKSLSSSSDSDDSDSSSDSSSSDSSDLSSSSDSDSSSDSSDSSDLSSLSDGSDSGRKNSKKRKRKGKEAKGGGSKKRRKQDESAAVIKGGKGNKNGKAGGGKKSKAIETNGKNTNRQARKRKLVDVKKEKKEEVAKKKGVGKKKTAPTARTKNNKKDKESPPIEKQPATRIHNTRYGSRNGFHKELEQPKEEVINCKNGRSTKKEAKAKKADKEENKGVEEIHVNTQQKGSGDNNEGEYPNDNSSTAEGRKGLRLSLSSRRKKKKPVDNEEPSTLAAD